MKCLSYNFRFVCQIVMEGHVRPDQQIKYFHGPLKYMNLFTENFIIVKQLGTETYYFPCLS